jgi:carboxymethylenebutenolidase
MPESTIALPTAEGPMGMFVAVPDGAEGGRRPALIVLQEAFGVNEHVRDVGRRLVGEGYVAVAPELFHRAGPGLEFGYTDWDRVKPVMGGLTRAGLTADLQAAFAYLKAHPRVDPAKIAVFGECLGGYTAVLASIELEIAGAVAFYPGGLNRVRPGIGFGPLLDSLGGVRCPLLLVYGGKDAGIPLADVAEVRSRLETLGKPHEVHVMPEGGHGFCCEARASYHRESAEQAWALALAWLRARLR